MISLQRFKHKTNNDTERNNTEMGLDTCSPFHLPEKNRQNNVNKNNFGEQLYSETKSTRMNTTTATIPTERDGICNTEADCQQLATNFSFLCLESPKTHSKNCPLTPKFKPTMSSLSSSLLQNDPLFDIPLLVDKFPLSSSLPLPLFVDNTTTNSSRSFQKLKHTLVLDLDETLIHAKAGFDQTADKNIEVSQDGVPFILNIFFRPYLQYFFETIRPLFSEIVLFTAARSGYADKILSLIDPDNKYFSRRFYRDSCSFINGEFKKDLTVIQKDLSTILLVDNTPSVMLSPENGYAIASYFGDSFDSSLLKLANDLVLCSSFSDIRLGLAKVRSSFNLFAPPNGFGLLQQPSLSSAPLFCNSGFPFDKQNNETLSFFSSPLFQSQFFSYNYNPRCKLFEAQVEVEPFPAL